MNVESMISTEFTAQKSPPVSLSRKKERKKTGYNTGEENSRTYYLLALRRETGMDGE